MRMNVLLRSAAAITLLAFSGCASSTLIRSTPSGARVYLDDIPVGRTPYTMTDMKLVGSSTRIRLEKPGYEPYETTVTRNEELDPWACAGGVFLLFPLAWLMKYVPEHAYTLEPKTGNREGPPASDQM